MLSVLNTAHSILVALQLGSEPPTRRGAAPPAALRCRPPPPRPFLPRPGRLSFSLLLLISPRHVLTLPLLLPRTHLYACAHARAHAPRLLPRFRRCPLDPFPPVVSIFRLPQKRCHIGRRERLSGLRLRLTLRAVTTGRGSG